MSTSDHPPDELLNEKLTALCKELANEHGSPPMGAVLIVEWPNGLGGSSVSLMGGIERSTGLKIVDSLARKFSATISSLKAAINKHTTGEEKVQ